jgi:hypothetical protein
MDRRLALGGDRHAALAQPGRELVAGQGARFGKDRRRLGRAALGDVLREAKLREPALPAPEVQLAEDGEHQRQVLGGDEVERAAHRPRADDAALVTLAGADGDGERGGGAVLGLDADEPADDFGGGGGLRARESLGVEAVAADRVGRQGGP